MIAKLIDSCIRNRGMVLVLTMFLVVAGAWAVFHVKVDAIPDLSDAQVIIYTEFTGQAPQIVEDQITYPLTKAMLAVPKSKVVRGYSMFGVSFVYVIFEDGTDLYWARSRVLERMSYILGQLPPGVTPQIGPDATGVGWIYEYALITGKYCPDHPNGLWRDPVADKWYAAESDASRLVGTVRARLVHHRVFTDRDTCPLDGKPLAPSRLSLADLRSLQDWYLRYELTSVPGVSEVASVGAFQKQYQVLIDPVKLLAFNMPLSQVKSAVERSNGNVGGRVVEWSEREYAIQGIGYLGTLSDKQAADAKAAGKTVEEARTEKVLADLRKVALGTTPDGSPIYLRDVADVRLGPEMRRGVIDWNGSGESVGGVVVMRFGENARTTIEGVRERLRSSQVGLPPGVEIETAYDRSDLIDRSVATLADTLIEEITVVSLVVVLFLLHARSALVAVFVLPTGVLACLATMQILGINANIMSLGGIAIAIGVMVDSSIIMVENAHKHLEREAERLAAGGAPRPRAEIISEAAREVGPSLFFALLIIVVSFLPIFVLGEQSGRLFKPLAYTKSFAMAAGALLAVTVIPVLMYYFVSERLLPKSMTRIERWLSYVGVIAGGGAILAVVPLATLAPWRWCLVGLWVVLSALIVLPQRIPHEDRNFLTRALVWAYQPAFNFVMRFRWFMLALALGAILVTLLPLSLLGTEFMPPLEEGDLLYMPTTDPGISMTKARELLQQTDKLIRSFPEVKSVMGKAGRVESATDPAPVSMFETTITLERDKSRWRRVRAGSGTRPITVDELIWGYDLPGGLHVPGLNEVVQVPGLTNSWTMPIRTRIDMLSTGIKTPVGVKIMGPDLNVLADVAARVADTIKTDRRTGPCTTSAFAEKTMGGSYLDIVPNRDEIARYGLSEGDVMDVISTAMGGMAVTTTIEGLERYTVNLRYPDELRDSLTMLKQTLVATPSKAQVPLGQLAEFAIRGGPDMIRSENARRSAWVYVDMAHIDVGTYVQNAQRAVSEKVALPAGYSIVWSGQYEYMQEARPKLIGAGLGALALIIVLLYAASRSWMRVGIVLLAVPFSIVGAVWFVWFLGYNVSIAVIVGIIALAGLDAETGMVMLLYLDTSFERFRREGRMRDESDLWHAVHDGAVKRIRPKTMTVLAAFVGLLPLMWASGAGADTMRRLAAPMIGGLATSFIMELLIYPVIYYIVKRPALFGTSVEPPAGKEIPS